MVNNNNNNNKGQRDADVGSFLDLIRRRLIGGAAKAARPRQKTQTLSLANFSRSLNSYKTLDFTVLLAIIIPP